MERSPMKWIRGLRAGIALVLLGTATLAMGQPVIEDITFSSQPGSKFEVRLDFSEAPPSETHETVAVRGTL